MLRSTLLHLRFPFSYFLLPVYLFALSQSPDFTADRLLWSFLLIHLFLYPASNGYNSYFDKDEQSIGGLKNPPPVNKTLYYAALLLDVVAIVFAILKISLLFG
ncbi:MAG: ubiquinone biosynthesis protein UbiA, partial [Bacteroidota bacterium]